MKITQFVLLAVICLMLPMGNAYGMRGRPTARPGAKKNSRTVPKRITRPQPPRGGQKPPVARVQRPLNDRNVNLDDLVAHFTPEEYELNFGNQRREVENIINDNNDPRYGVVADPVADNEVDLDAFMADLTEEEYALNFGHKRNGAGFQMEEHVAHPVLPVKQERDRRQASAELFRYIEQNRNYDIEDIEDLLARGADINARQRGLTPLLVAVIQGNGVLCQTLIDHGADVSIPMNGDYAIELSQVNFGHVFWRLQVKSVDHNDQVSPSLTALHIAAGFGNQGIVKMLIDADADCNAITPDGWTPLLLTSTLLRKPGNRASLVDNIKLLVDGGADVNTCALMTQAPLDDMYGRSSIAGIWLTPLLNALATNDAEMRTYLFEKGAQVNIHNNMPYADGRIIPLVKAAERLDVPLCQVLLAQGADVRFKNSDGQSVWEHACINHLMPLCDALIKESHFIPTELEISEAFARIKTTLLTFNRLGKRWFPRDIVYMILQKPALLHDFMMVMFDRVQKGKPIPKVIVQNILPWLKAYKILQLQNGMRPVHAALMAKPYLNAADAPFIGVLDPDTIEKSFGKEIEEGITKRFGPKEQPKPADDKKPE